MIDPQQVSAIAAGAPELILDILNDFHTEAKTPAHPEPSASLISTKAPKKAKANASPVSTPEKYQTASHSS